MTTYYIAPSTASPAGNDANAGTEASPWRTLNKACTVAGAGDTVLMRGGTYLISGEHDFEPSGLSGNLLVITNYPGETPIFDGTGGTFGSTDAVLSVDPASKYADVGGFTIRNNAQGAALGRGLEISSSISPSKANHLTFRDIIIHDVNERGFGGGGDDITVINVEIYNFCMSNLNEALGGGGGWASGLATFSYSDSTLPINWLVQDCYIHEGWGEGIIALRSGSGSGEGMWVEDTTVANAYSKLIYIDKSQHVVVRRNTLVFNNITYRKTGDNADSVTFAVEGTPLHGTTYEVDDVEIYNNQFVGVRRGVSWFTDSADNAATYRDVHIWHNSMYSIVDKAFRFPAVGGATAPSSCEARNNICDGGLITLADAAAWTFTHNCWIDGIPTTGTHTNSIHANPLYEAPSTAITVQLTISATSPCIGVGTYLAAVPTDYAGATRPNPPTIGAFEQTASAPGDTENQAYCSSFLTGTSTIGTTFDVTDPGFQPTAIYFWWSGRTESVDATGSQSAKRGSGFATGASNQACTTAFALDAAAALTDTSERHTNAACVSILINSTTRDGELKLNSMLSNGFRMEAVTTQFTTSYRIHYLAIKCRNATVGTGAAPVVTGVETKTGLAFRPTTLFVAGGRASNPFPSTNVDSSLFLGVAVSAAKQFVLLNGSNDAAATSVTLSYCRSGEIFAMFNTGVATVDTIAALTGFTADGWSWDFTQVSGTAHSYCYLALDADNVDIGDFLTQLDTTTEVKEALSFSTVGGIVVSANRAASTTDTPTAEDQWSFGGFSAPPVRQGAHATRDDNGVVASSDTHAAVDFDGVYINLNGSGAVQGALMVQAVEVDSVTFVNSVADVAQSFCPYWVIGNVVAPVDSTPATSPIVGHIARLRKRLRR
ncbi:hypothetical protein [Caudoviricetes sp.]|nr:hypothetical protein [Caudoviricetes sp.]UOF81082.1 hypothetical protein [Caudoviricetes sp.]UOF82205.1 hypothetical protein [Caudoviricetes sp.]UOF82427.1 hypothetical protein [Caudoviricetes sp.]UOF82601.1 hypothetical protein [Caudoviricetes sp.]